MRERWWYAGGRVNSVVEYSSINDENSESSPLSKFPKRVSCPWAWACIRRPEASSQAS